MRIAECWDSWGDEEAALSIEQRQELLRFLAARVNGDRTGDHLSDLAEFAGALHLREDPLAWQQRVR